MNAEDVGKHVHDTLTWANAAVSSEALWGWRGQLRVHWCHLQNELCHTRQQVTLSTEALLQADIIQTVTQGGPTFQKKPQTRAGLD